MLADPEFANKAKRGHEDQIRRCLRCYKCFPGSPEEGYDDLPFTSEELALYVGHCTINPLAHLPFDPDTLAPASKQETVLIVGGGAAGMQAAITACDPGPEGHPGRAGPPPGRPAAVHRRGHRQARPDELQEPAGARGGAP